MSRSTDERSIDNHSKLIALVASRRRVWLAGSALPVLTSCELQRHLAITC